MKTKYLKLSLLAVLVAGATMIISCEKENNENGLTTNVQPKIGGGTEEAIPLPPGGGGGGGNTTTSKVTIFYLHITKTHDENGKLVFIKECLPKKSNYGICYIRVNITDENFGVGYEGEDMQAVLTLNDDHQLTRLSINTETLNPKDYESLSILADKIGYVEFNENIVINDEEGLLPFEVKEVPAGKYPISLIDNEFIIDFEY
ncbi:MAG: hypothetical protein IKT84_02170 [Bacteroidales bacterium]|nr:hypothetical protein [Bacteroidales bacterium]